MSNPNHDPKNGEFSTGGGSGGGSHAAKLATAFHAKHKELAAKLKSNHISDAEVTQLDKMNQFVLHNVDGLKALKKSM